MYWIPYIKDSSDEVRYMDANVSPDPLWKKDQGVIDTDDRVVLAGASLGIAMLAIWVVFVAALVWTRGAG
jgi:hypothetical protein